MNVEIKLAALPDVEDILDMMAEFNAIDNYSFNRLACRKLLTEFIKDGSLGRLWVVTIQELKIGYVVLAFGFSFEYGGRDAFIDELYIKERHRDRGIGRRLMDHVAQEALKLGVKAIHLEVEKHNNNANHLYRKVGYKENNRALLSRKLAR